MDTYQPVKLYSVHYIPEEYDADLPPILFVHGIAGLHSSWNRVWKRIADQTKRKVFAIDLRNHGKSEWNDCNALEAVVVDLENFLTENGIKKCCLVGHSLGGRACMRLSMKKPEMVDRLVVEEAFVRNGNQKAVSAVMAVFRTAMKMLPAMKNMPERQIRALFSKLISKEYPQRRLGAAGFNIPLRQEPDGSTGLDFNMEAVNRYLSDGSLYMIDLEVGCHKFTGPTLFVYTKQLCNDMENSSSGDMFGEGYFPNSQLCLMEGDAHVLHRECPDKYVQKLSEFFNH